MVEIRCLSNDSQKANATRLALVNPNFQLFGVWCFFPLCKPLIEMHSTDRIVSCLFSALRRPPRTCSELEKMLLLITSQFLARRQLFDEFGILMVGFDAYKSEADCGTNFYCV